MGKLVTEVFSKQIIELIEAKEKYASLSLPDKFKSNWFEWVHYSYEAKKDDCEIDDDGLWKLKKPNHNNKRVKFLWRIEPNYNTYGRPSYTSEQIDNLYKNSETKKSILKLEKFEICLEWFGFDYPTETCWGLRMKQVHVTIYENSTKIFSCPLNRTYKKELTNFIKDYFAY